MLSIYANNPMWLVSIFLPLSRYYNLVSLVKTISISLLAKDSLDPIAILDTDLCLVNCSDIFLAQFAHPPFNVYGKKLQDLVTELPENLHLELKECLKGKTILNKGTKLRVANGSTRWLTWKIQCIKDPYNVVKGVSLVLEDITEIKRFEDLLLRTEMVSRTGSWEVDLPNNKIYWSPMTRIIHEVAPDYVLTLETAVNFYKEGRYRNLMSQIINTAMLEGTPWDTELLIITSTGKEVWVRAQGETEFVNGICTRIFGTFQDIDKKKTAELKYQKTTARLKIATDTANIGIWEYDISKDKLLWDDTMYALYGIKKEDFLITFKSWQKRIHPNDQLKTIRKIEKAIAGKKVLNTEFKVVWSNGTIKYLKAIAKTEHNTEGKAIKMIGTHWDITELKATQLKLERNKESFLDTFYNAAIGMALVDLNGQWIRVNKSICNSLGYTEPELSKKTFKDITYKEDLDAGLALLQETKEGKRDSYQMEKRYCHKDGSIVYAIVTVTVVRDIYGNILHFIAQVLDMTSRIAAEKKLKTLVNVTKTQNASLLNFAHIVSHNLRSHSTNLSMLTKFLAVEHDPSEISNITQMLTDASHSLSDTIEDLNDVVQVKTDTTKKMRSINLADTLNGIEHGIQTLFNSKNAKTIVNVPQSHKVLAVPAYLESIFLNLYTNALKYSSPERAPVITISSEVTKKNILIKFGDNGLGIDLKRHGKKLFGMYKTFHNHKEAKGIGLFITKNQIESMRGSITAESEPNIGSTFIITLEKG